MGTSYRPRKLKLSAEAEEIFAATELEGRQRILHAVSKFFDRAMDRGHACMALPDCVIGVTCEPEAVVVSWIQKREADFAEAFPLREAA